MLEALILGAAFIAFLLPISMPLQLFIVTCCLLLALPGIMAGMGGAPFVPTGGRTMRTMLDWAKIRPGESVVDIGCGDGRFVIAAAKAGGKSLGYELSLPLYAIARARAFFTPGSTVELKDFWAQDYRSFDVVLCFQTKATMQKFHAIIWPQLKPGCRVVSHAFAMNDVEPVKRGEQVVMYVK